MQIIKCREDIARLEDNRIIGGNNIEFINSDIIFEGKNNILYCEENVKLVASHLKFHGSNCIIYLSSNRHEYRLTAAVYYNSVLYIGKNNYFNDVLTVILSEQKNLFAGKENLFSFGIFIRTADPHLIYSAASHKRINPSKSVFIGDHVWFGQDSMLLKGTEISSGSIIGAKSLVSGKAIPSNEVWGGNPAKKISDGIFWSRECVHAWNDRKTAEHEYFKGNKYIFSFNKSQHISFSEIDKMLSTDNTEKKLEYLKQISCNNDKNRFALNGKTKKKTSLFGRKLVKLWQR